MKNLIAIYSPVMGCGKSTAAQFLSFAYDFVPVGFAQPIKAMTRALLQSAGVEQEEVNAYLAGHLKEKPVPFAPVTCRMIMQTLGTEWGRQTIHEEIWVETLIERVDALLAGGDSVVIDDMRFPNEYEALAEYGATFVRIDRPSALNREPHESEGGLEGWRFHHEITNDGSVEDLYGKINRILMEDI